MTVVRFLTTIILLLLSVTAAEASQRWEEVSRMPRLTTEQRTDSDADAITVETDDGYVYVAIKQRTAVKIFTILGQPIVQETLQPGIYRFRLKVRGIYLLKAGETTRRLTI